MSEIARQSCKLQWSLPSVFDERRRALGLNAKCREQGRSLGAEVGLGIGPDQSECHHSLQSAEQDGAYVVTVDWLANACVESTSRFAMELGYRIATRASSVSTESPHPEEHRVAMRLEGWATSLLAAHPSRRALRALLRVRWCGFTFSESALARFPTRRGEFEA
jgi:hypothetical protein